MKSVFFAVMVVVTVSVAQAKAMELSAMCTYESICTIGHGCRIVQICR